MRRLLILVVPLLAASTLTGCGSQPSSPTTGNRRVIFRHLDGRTISTDDLHWSNDEFRYDTVGKWNVPTEAESLLSQARQAGSAGEYSKAISLLDQAAQLAPDWPYPVYTKAFTYVLMKDTANAVKHYRRTVEMSPRGFFIAITAVDALTREENGDLPAGTFRAYVSLDWLDEEKKAAAVRLLTERVPGFAPAWKELVLLTDNDAEKLSLIEKALALQPDAETKGVLETNKALVLARRGEHENAVQLLGELILDPSSTIGTEHLAKVALASLVGK